VDNLVLIAGNLGERSSSGIEFPVKDGWCVLLRHEIWNGQGGGMWLLACLPFTEVARYADPSHTGFRQFNSMGQL
jgi:hypothetical protein